ncbi:MAG: UPF0158 family protein [candidate division WOR-3 bacterium]
MRELKVLKKDLLFALDNRAEGIPHYLDTETGEVVPVFSYNRDRLLSEFRAVPGRYVRLAPLSGRQGYAVMEEFTRTVANVPLRSRLTAALQSENVFRSFRAALVDYPEELERWRHFRAESVTQGIRDRLKELGIELVLVADNTRSALSGQD